MRRVLVQQAPIDITAELEALGQNGAGAVASFTGLVRATANGHPLAALRLEHYPGMTERALTRLAKAAQTRWDLSGCTIIHRIGRLTPGETIVLAAAASRHRAAALAATGFLIDRLKTGAPFWKAEEFTDGTTAWVRARAEDEAAAATWDEIGG